MDVGMAVSSHSRTTKLKRRRQWVKTLFQYTSSSNTSELNLGKKKKKKKSTALGTHCDLDKGWLVISG